LIFTVRFCVSFLFHFIGILNKYFIHCDQTSAGRIHPAKISCVNAHNRTVTVEWIENGETKAKEVIFFSLYYASIPTYRIFFSILTVALE